MPVLAADHRDEPDQTEYAPHEPIGGACHNEWHRYQVRDEQKHVEHGLMVVRPMRQKVVLLLAAAPRQLTSSVVRSRHVPAAVRRAVWKRDDGRCAFIGTDGRCAERGFLEFHHVVPFADGGETTSGNLQLRCRAHNAHEAREHFGDPVVERRSSVSATRSGPS